MTRRDTILELLARAAAALGPDLSNVVFVGGAVPAVYPGRAVDIRMTEDIDCVSNVSLSEYHALLQRLRRSGFRPVVDERAPACRLRLGDDLLLDVMPIDPRILGFSNQWYAPGVANAEEFVLPTGLRIRALSPTYFVATKLEAFDGRGRADPLSSHDLEDVIALLLARPDLVTTFASGAPVDQYVRGRLHSLLRDDTLVAAVFGAVPPDDVSQEQCAALVAAIAALPRD